MTRYKLIIEYQGNRYSGWQRQADVPSVQEAIERAIHGFCGQSVTLHVAGRTDAGVHARGQVAHCDLAPFSKPMSSFEITKAINAHLRSDTACILDVVPVSDDFHARFSAIKKLYHYKILNRSAFPAIERGLVWHTKKPLDVARMHEAAQYLVGAHDFTTFRDSQCQAKSPLKTLDRLDVSARPYDSAGGVEILIAAEGRSFLHHQVRNMVGSLALVGEGKWSSADLHSALEAKDRKRGGPTAPPDGLYLIRVDYGRQAG